MLRLRGFRIQIETAGTVWIPGLEAVNMMFVCSPKSSKVHKEILARCNHFKYIVGKGDAIENGVIVSKTQPNSKLMKLAVPKSDATIWIQPRDDHDVEANEFNMKYAKEICLENGYRFSVQLHKLLEVA
jgi:organic radical activating enzyme